MKLESKIGKIEEADNKIYDFLTNFNNFKNFVPLDKVEDWESDENSCKFKIAPVGQTGFKISEKTPNQLIKLTNLEQTAYDFSFWAQLKQISPKETAIRLTIDAKLNPMMTMMAKKPIQTFLDSLVDKLKLIKYQ